MQSSNDSNQEERRLTASRNDVSGKGHLSDYRLIWSVSDMLGSPTDEGQYGVSPPQIRAVTRRMVGSISHQVHGGTQPASIHEIE